MFTHADFNRNGRALCSAVITVRGYRGVHRAKLWQFSTGDVAWWVRGVCIAWPHQVRIQDQHLFHSIKGSTVAEVVGNWRLHNQQLQPATVGGEPVSDMGPSNLCPIIVLSWKKELRRVGPMVFPRGARLRGACDEDELQKWIDAAHADPDIPRLLKEAK